MIAIKDISRWLAAAFLYCSATVAQAQTHPSTIYHYGGLGEDELRDVAATMDGGFVMVGSTGSFGNGASDIYVIKVDSNLHYQWSRAVGGNNVDWGNAIVQTSDGGYAIAGYTNDHMPGSYEAYLVRLDANGLVLWSRTFGGSDWDFAYDLAQMPDGGFVLCGETHSDTNGGSDLLAVRTDANGNTIWTKTLGGSENDVANRLLLTSNQTIAIAGSTQSFGNGGADGWLVAFDYAGDTTFTNTFGGPGDDFFNDLFERPDTSIFLVGATSDTGWATLSQWMLNAHQDGSYWWQNNIGNTPMDDIFNSVVLTSNQQMCFAGSTLSGGIGNGFEDISVFVTDYWGVFVTGLSFGSTKADIGYSITNVNDSTVLVGATMEKLGPGQADYTLIRSGLLPGVDSTVAMQDTAVSVTTISGLGTQPGLQPPVTLWPNPASGFINVELPEDHTFYEWQLLHLNGTPVAAGVLGQATKHQIDCASVRSGLYILSLRSRASANSNFRVVMIR